MLGIRVIYFEEMMNTPHQVIKVYIEKLMQIREEERNRLPTSQELKDLVQELGFSEDDYLLIQNVHEEHHQNGKGFQELENWREAIKEYEQALNLNPYQVSTLVNLGFAYKKLWNEDFRKENRLRAKYYARRTLKIRPGYKPALKIIDEISRYEYEQRRVLGIYGLGAALMAYLIYVLSQFF